MKSNMLYNITTRYHDLSIKHTWISRLDNEGSHYIFQYFHFIIMSKKHGIPLETKDVFFALLSSESIYLPT